MEDELKREFGKICALKWKEWEKRTRPKIPPKVRDKVENIRERALPIVQHNQELGIEFRKWKKLLLKILEI